jgi:hypothetical protein
LASVVHNFVCRGTIEGRLDQLIEAKQQLVKDVLEGGAKLLLTEMSDHELLDLVRLDIHSARKKKPKNWSSGRPARCDEIRENPQVEFGLPACRSGDWYTIASNPIGR